MPRRGNGPANPFRNKIVIALLAVFALFAFVGPALFFKSARMEPMTLAEFEATRAGGPAHLVGKVTDVRGDGFDFEILEGPAEALTLTGRLVEARGTRYRVTLGKPEDVKPGAIVIVDGLKRDDRTIEPGGVLILTGKVPTPQ